MLIDSHAHLNFSAYDKDRDQVIKRCQDRQMKVINVGSQLATSLKAIEIANRYNACPVASPKGCGTGGFFASVGIHPIHVGNYERDELETAEHQDLKDADLPQVFDEIVKLAKEGKVVAIGETGLDYFRIKKDDEITKNLQKEYFIRHIELAKKNDLPIIFHCRGSKDSPLDAYKEVLEIIGDVPPSPNGFGVARGVIHCFGANLEIAQKFIDLGIYIGFTGIVTFAKKAEELQDVAKNIPFDKLLIETDCPYLSPESYRGERNEPVYVELVAKKIAELRGLTFDEVVEQTGNNAEKLFKI